MKKFIQNKDIKYSFNLPLGNKNSILVKSLNLIYLQKFFGFYNGKFKRNELFLLKFCVLKKKNYQISTAIKYFFFFF